MMARALHKFSERNYAHVQYFKAVDLPEVGRTVGSRLIALSPRVCRVSRDAARRAVKAVCASRVASPCRARSHRRRRGLG